MLSVLIYVVMKYTSYLSLYSKANYQKKKIRKKGYVCPADIFVCRYLIATVVFSTNKQSTGNLKYRPFTKRTSFQMYLITKTVLEILRSVKYIENDLN